MKKINLAITGCMGRMGQQLIKSSKSNNNFNLVSLTENIKINKKFNGIKPESNTEMAFRKADIIIDFTIPKCTMEVIKIASKLSKKVVIGTTGFSSKEEKIIKKYSKKIPILKAGNMSLGVNLLMYLTEIASKSLNDKYLSKIFEIHHKHKKDYPSGTALMLGKGIAEGKNKDLYSLIGKKFLNKKKFPYGKKINFNSIRKGEIIGEHEVKFSSGKEIISLNHEAFDRTLYSDGALTAAMWLMKKKTWSLFYERFIKFLIMNEKTKAKKILRILNKIYPTTPAPLKHKNIFTLLVSVLLSAQCTDLNVNNVTKNIYPNYYKPEHFVKLGRKKIESLIKKIGIFRIKAKSIYLMSKQILEKHNGRVPKTFDELEKLPGVGHKTASVVMSQGFGYPAFAVDTHIHRLAQRWGLTSGKDVIQTEKDLKRIFPKETWSKLHLQIIFYGREYCKARDCYGLSCKICTTCYPNRKKPFLTKKP
jgi:endonuclease III/4-hydroxy-tetrahydrodipicolinate reductase